MRFETGQYDCFHAEVGAITYAIKGEKLRINNIEKGLNLSSNLAIKQNQQFELSQLNELLELIKKGASNYLKEAILEEMNSKKSY